MPSYSRLRTILALAIPIIGGMLSQNILNMVDTYMVSGLGNTALAAVGLASFTNFIFQAPLMALSAGVQAMAARRMGEGKSDVAGIPLNGGLVLALGLGIPLTMVLLRLAPVVFDVLASDPGVRDAGTPYLQMRMLAVVFVGMNFSFRGFWNATHRAWFYMGTLVLMHSANIFLNWVFIYGNLGMPEMGVEGAAMASTAATVLGTLAYFILASAKARGEGFLRGFPDPTTLRTMLRLSVPTAIQQMFFAGGITAFMWIIGRLGTESLAVSKVVLDVVLIALLPAMGFGLAGTTLVGEALGRGEPDEARRWGWHVCLTALLTVSLAMLPAAIFPRAILGVFIHDPATLELGALPLRLVGLTVGIDAVGMVMMQSLLGAGDNQRVMRISIVTQWVFYIPLIYALVLTGHAGLLTVWMMQAGYRAIQAVIYVAMWRGDHWTRIRV